MEIYAPLANRLGIWQIKWELEDLVVPVPRAGALQADRAAHRSRSAPRASATSPRSRRSCARSWRSTAIKAEVQGRAKHIYSIHQKMQKYAGRAARRFNEIYDLLALRVLVDTVADCYNALGVVHGLWRPDPGPVRRLHRQPEGERLPVAAHDRDGDRRAAAGDPDPHARDAPARRVRRRRALALQGRRQAARPALRGAHVVAAPAPRVAARDAGRRGVRRVGEDRHLPGPGLRLHAEGRDQGPARRRHADRLRLPHPHRPGPPLRRRARSTAAWCRSTTSSRTATSSRSSPARTRAGRRATGSTRTWATSKTGHAREKIRQWFKQAGARREHRPRAARCSSKELRRLGLYAERAPGRASCKFFKYETLDDFFAALGYGGVSTAPGRDAPGAAASTRTTSRSCQQSKARRAPPRRRATPSRCSAPATC